MDQANANDANDGNDGSDLPYEGLDADAFAAALEDFNRFYIRLPVLEHHPFTTLSVLDTLAHADEPMSLTALARTEQMSQPGITQLVTRLERDGLLERRRCTRDGRVVRIHITEEGRRVGRSRHADRVAHLTPLFDELTASERESVAAALPALTRLAALGRDRRREEPLPNKAL